MTQEINEIIIKQGLIIEYEYIDRLDRTVIFTHNPDDFDGKVNIDFLWGPCSKDDILERVKTRD